LEDSASSGSLAVVRSSVLEIEGRPLFFFGAGCFLACFSEGIFAFEIEGLPPFFGIV
jgi:hypothetical protein